MRQIGIIAALAGLAACGSKDETNVVVTAEAPAAINNMSEIVDAPLNNIAVPDEPPPGNTEAPAAPKRKAAAVPPGDPPGSRCSRTPETAANRAPTVVMRALSTKAEEKGFVVKLRAKATDPDKDPLFYTFSVTAGSTTSDGGPDLTWHLPEPGLYTATVEVDDRRGCITFSSISQDVGRPTSR